MWRTFDHILTTMTINTQHPENGSGLRREVGEICSLLSYFAACSGNSLPNFQGS